MKATVTIVFFEVLGKRKYVSEMSIRSDNKIIPMYDDSQAEAHHFFDEDHARKKIALFHNIHNREFKTEQIEVRVSNRNPFTSKHDGALVK